MKITKQNDQALPTTNAEQHSPLQDNQDTKARQIDVNKKILNDDNNYGEKEPVKLEARTINMPSSTLNKLSKTIPPSKTQADEGYISDSSLNEIPEKTVLSTSERIAPENSETSSNRPHNRTKSDKHFQFILNGVADFLLDKTNQKQTNKTLLTLNHLYDENISKTQQAQQIMDILTRPVPTLASRLFKKSSTSKTKLENNVVSFLQQNHEYDLKHLFCKKMCSLDNYRKQKGGSLETLDTNLLNYLEQIIKEDNQLIGILISAPRLLNYFLSKCTTEQIATNIDLICNIADELNLYGLPETEQDNGNLTGDEAVSSMCEAIKSYLTAYQKENNIKSTATTNVSHKTFLPYEELQTILSKTATLFNHMDSGDQLLTLFLNKIIDEDIINLDLNSLDMITQLFLSASLTNVISEKNGSVPEQLQAMEQSRESLTNKTILTQIMGEYEERTKNASEDTKAFFLGAERLYDLMLTQSTENSACTFKTYLNFLIQQDMLHKSEELREQKIKSEKGNPKDHGIVDTLSDEFRVQLRDLSSDKLKLLRTNKEKVIKQITDKIQKNLEQSDCTNTTEAMILQFYINLLETTSI